MSATSSGFTLPISSSKLRHPSRKPILISTLSVLTACTNTTYRAYEARDAVVHGTGGTRDVVDGMDIWQTGDPPRKYLVVGVIDDDRAHGLIQMSARQSDMVTKAKEVGGDAIIKIASGSRVISFQTQGTRSSATTTPLLRNTSCWAVIKYLE